jgi:phosphohistidine phosphatase
MRHGKTEDGFGKDDFERQLIQRGREEAKEAAKALAEAGYFPNSIIASPAFRAAITAQIVAHEFDMMLSDIQFEAGFYMNGMEPYLQTANDCNSETVLLIGHNPHIGELAYIFSKNQLPNFPTSAMAVFEFDGPISMNTPHKLLWSHTRK